VKNMRHLLSFRSLVASIIAVEMILVATVSVFAVTETDAPPCRWPHTSGSNTYLYYKWGSGLQTPGSLWRNAFETAIYDWAVAPTRVYWNYSSGGSITIQTYWAQDGWSGKAIVYCSGSTTVGYDVYGNVYYDVQLNYTVNQRHAVAGHETGHGQSLGHISGSTPALLGYNPDPNTYYSPQQPDIDLTNQVYP
jgi:hypothetical protein